MQVPVTGVFDTGAGPSLIHANALLPGWQSKLLTKPHPRITDGSRNRMQTLRAIRLFIRIVNLEVWDHFPVSTNLATSCLLGTTLIDNHKDAMHP